jgi:probable poly-beta-1,6-N-acetyl-D-glucosamine export protein
MIRAISCLMILAIHVTGSFYYIHDQHHVWYTSFFNQISRYGINLFIMISGFLLFYHKKQKGFEAKHYWKSRTLKVIIPFLAFTVFYQIITALYNGYSNFTFSIDYFYSMIYLGDGFYHLWFFSLVLQFYLLFPLLQRWSNNKKQWNIMLVCSLTVQLIFLKIVPLYVHWEKVYLFNWIYYFILGGYLAQYWVQIRDWIQSHPKTNLALTLLVLADGLWSFYRINSIAEYRLENMISVPILFVVLIGVYPKIQQWRRTDRTLTFIGEYSMGIYVMHPLFIYYATFMPKFFWDPTSIFFTFLFYLLVSVLSLKLFEKVPYYQYFIPIPKVKNQIKA